MRWFTKSWYAFHHASASTLLVLSTLVVLLAVFFSNSVPQIPKNLRDLDLEGAYHDLHQITRQPHSINSHANDLVRSYILDKLHNISLGYPYVQVFDDTASNASYATSGRGVSFEGSNILVKIEGYDSKFTEQGGVLFSAHFDSVSTGPGVTDDGIGVVTLIALVKYLCSHRPRRTAIFNINNGEEDGLNGAHTFLEHPWAKIPDTFLNLEGAAAGGRPLLFRSSSASPVRAFKNSAISHPHGNVLSADAFATGIIKSGTDYTVYNTGSGDVQRMQGVDLAFYQGRSKYHTKYDSISGAALNGANWVSATGLRGVAGAKESLWLMMETVLGAGWNLLNDDQTHVGQHKGEPPVYFDVLGSSFFVCTQKTLFSINISLLVIGPLVLFALYHLPINYRSSAAWRSSTARPFRRFSERTAKVCHSIVGLGWAKKSWWIQRWQNTRSTFPQSAKDCWIRTRFWATLIVCVAINVIIVLLFIKVNPYIAYSHPYTVLAVFLSLSFLSAATLLSYSPQSALRQNAVEQKTTTMLHLYFLSYLFLVGTTVLLNTAHIGGFYFMTVWNACAGLGCVSALYERAFEQRKSDARDHAEERDMQGAVDDPTRLSREDNDNKSIESVDGQHFTTSAWWILQFLLVVPAPFALILEVLVLFIDALYQTLADGGPVFIVYAPMALLSLFLVFTTSPFLHNTHAYLRTFVAFIFLTSLIIAWTKFPFSQEAPLLVFFSQAVSVNLSNPDAAPTTLTTLTALPYFLDAPGGVVDAIPSSWGKKLSCKRTSEVRSGLRSCSWESGANMLPSPVGRRSSSQSQNSAATWFTANATRLSSNSARISVKGNNTRSCRVLFDDPVSAYTVYGNEDEVKAGKSNQPKQDTWPVQGAGIRDLWLMSRSWDHEFVVDVWWNGTEPDRAVESSKRAISQQLLEGEQKFSGRVGCAWAEYESATIGLDFGDDSIQTGSIPAYEEVLTYVPKWAVSTKFIDPLVTVTGKWEV